MPTNRQSTATLAIHRVAMGVALMATLAGCGYKGPLYMPPPPPPDAVLTTPPQPTQPLTDSSQSTLPATTTVTPVE